MSSFYITTPIYYVNGEPHLGHAYTTIVADAFARHYRQRGFDVFFMTGTDEHGMKVQREAEKLGETPQAFVDRISQRFRDLFDRLELSHDRFIRTTEKQHHDTVVQVVERMKANGDVYLDTYAGWYSVADEAFYDESEIEDGRHKEFGSAVEWVEEASYFFKLSAYEEKLLAWYGDDDNHVRPDSRRNEVRSFVAGGLNDLSISRTTFDWGIQWPGDPEHVLYVWVDALTNYLTGVGGFDDEELFQKYWPCDMHLIGKDILRFHAVYWPAFLMSAGVEPPKQVYAHGWWTIEGAKMSKRDGNFVDPFALVDEWDLDVVRYFLLREMPLGNDGDFSKQRVAERNNAELADNLGNLVNRALAMSRKFIDGTVPTYLASEDEDDVALRDSAAETLAHVTAFMDARESHRAVDAVMRLSSDVNGYIQKAQPWKLAKDEANAERVAQVLYNVLEGIRWVSVLGAAFLPKTSARILSAFGLSGDAAISFESLEWGGLEPVDLAEVPVLFQKFELSSFITEAEMDESEGEDTDPTDDAADDEHTARDVFISYDQFLAVEVTVAKILTAELVDGADKLLRITADVGEPAPRQIVAGIAKSFTPDELIGAHVAAVTNLQPRKIFGLESQAMLLAAERPDGKLELTRYTDAIAPGTRVS